MGLLTRKDAKSSRRQTPRPRPSVSSEAQAAGLRVRARRRLAGAVALVLAAVIVLPMLLDGEPRPVPTGIEIVVPGKNSTFSPDLGQSVATATETVKIDKDANKAASDAQQTTKATASTPEASKPVLDAEKTSKPATTQSVPTTQSSPPPQKAESVDQKTDKPVVAKPDNTAVAMAILEGRKPEPSAKPAPKAAPLKDGDFTVQVAAYNKQSDAESRRDKLKSQGISNAYVEAATINGFTNYRLRVGPFGSRAAAQAAQTRLRTLGYGDGLILTK